MSDYTPQAYPLYAMVISADRFDLDPELNRDPVEPLSPADVCLVVGWKRLADGDEGSDMVPVLAEIGSRFGADMGLSPLWPVDGSYYELSLAWPSDSDRMHFARGVAEIVRTKLARKHRAESAA